MEYISIKYNKNTGEFTIKRRDYNTNTITEYANSLYPAEKEFCKNAKYCKEENNVIIWCN